MNQWVKGQEDTPPNPGVDLTVIVPAVNGLDILLETLEALHGQRGGTRLEVIVPDRNDDRTRSVVRDRYPHVNLIPVEPGTSIPTMRRLSFEAARGRGIAVIEDHVIVPPDWASSLVGALDGGARIVGGWVYNAATDRLADRAAFICEYGHMLTLLPSGEAPWLTGNNVAYAHELIREFWSVIEEERWEDRLHGAIAAAGIPLVLLSDVQVAHKMHFESAFEYAGQRFLYSRGYAAMRLRDAGAGKRAFHGLASLALPPILLVRIVKNGWVAPQVRLDLIKSAPFLALFVVAWALGESLGALRGPGDSLGRVR